jgi:CheY-like chemotaxis protein
MNTRPLHVLVVEDHPETAQATATLLRLSGHEVEVAPDGETGVAMARDHPPDVVLLDLGLPGMNGWEVAREVREQPAAKRPFLVAVSGYACEEDHRRSAEAGIDLHLAKPVDPDWLTQLLSRFRQFV